VTSVLLRRQPVNLTHPDWTSHAIRVSSQSNPVGPTFPELRSQRLHPVRFSMKPARPRLEIAGNLLIAVSAARMTRTSAECDVIP